MPDTSFRSLLALVDRLYAAAVDPREWQPFLSDVASFFDADHAFICQAENRMRPFDYVGLDRTVRSVVPVSRFMSLMRDDPRGRSFNVSFGRATHCRMAVSTSELHRSRVYREYLEPLNFEYTLAVAIPSATNFTHDLGLVRGRSRPPFTMIDCELLNELVPHLTRAFDIRRKFAETGSIALPAAPIALSALTSDLDRVRARLNLAPAQARLAIAISQGQTVKEAAAALAITEGSARQYLRRIFRSTGMRRQADLVRIVGRVLDETG